MNQILDKIKNIKLEKEVMAALALVALFSVFLLVNFNWGFNLFLYVIIALAGLIIPIIYPRSGLYASLALTLIWTKFFTLQSLWFNDTEYKFYLLDILLVATLLGLGLRLLSRQVKLKIKLADILLLIFIILTAVYFLVSWFYLDGNFLTAFSSFKNYAFYPLLYFAVCLLIDNRQHLKKLLGFVLLGGFIIIGFIIYGVIVGQGLWTEITPLSTIGSRLLDFDHAFYLCLISLLGLGYLAWKKDWLNKIWYWLLPIFALGIAGSLMRHLWLALLITLLFFLWFLPAEQRRRCWQILSKYLAGAIMALVLLIMLVNFLPVNNFSQSVLIAKDQLITRALSLSNQEDSSLAWRGAVWQSVWQDYKEQIVAGLGFGQKVFIDMGGYRDYVEVRNIHNSWLAVFVQMGLIGFIWLLWFFFNVLKNVFKLKNLPADLALARLTVLSIGIFCLIAFAFQPYLEANFFNIWFWLNLGLGRKLYAL